VSKALIHQKGFTGRPLRLASLESFEVGLGKFLNITFIGADSAMYRSSMGLGKILSLGLHLS